MRQARGTVDVQRASDLLGGGAQGYMRLWDLVSNGLVHVPLDSAIDLDSSIATVGPTGGAAWLHAF